MSLEFHKFAETLMAEKDAEIERLKAVNARLTKAIETYLADWDDDGIADIDIRRFRVALAAERQLTEDLEAGNNRLGNKLDKANLDIERLNERLTAVEGANTRLTKACREVDSSLTALASTSRQALKPSQAGMYLRMAEVLRAALAAAKPAATPAKEGNADG